MQQFQKAITNSLLKKDWEIDLIYFFFPQVLLK